jgi:hypothetical protein
MAFLMAAGQMELGVVMSMMVGDGGGGGEVGFWAEVAVLVLEVLGVLYSMILRVGSMSLYPAWVWRRCERNLRGVRLVLMGFVMMEVGVTRSMSCESWKRMGAAAVWGRMSLRTELAMTRKRDAWLLSVDELNFSFVSWAGWTMYDASKSSFWKTKREELRAWCRETSLRMSLMMLELEVASMRTKFLGSGCGLFSRWMLVVFVAMAGEMELRKDRKLGMLSGPDLMWEMAMSI